MANTTKDRTEYTFYKTFHDEEHDYFEDVMIHVPFDLLMNELHEFCLEYFEVNIDGTDNAVWNLFSGTNFIEDLFDNDEDFLDQIIYAYEHSPYIEEDHWEWASSEPWEVL